MNGTTRRQWPRAFCARWVRNPIDPGSPREIRPGRRVSPVVEAVGPRRCGPSAGVRSDRGWTDGLDAVDDAHETTQTSPPGSCTTVQVLGSATQIENLMGTDRRAVDGPVAGFRGG